MAEVPSIAGVDALTLLDTLEHGVGIHDLQGRMVYVNCEAGRILGRDPDVLVGLGVGEVLSTDRAWGERERFDLELARPDGSSCWASIRTQPARDAEGQQIGSLVCITDITDRKLREQHLERVRRELEAANRRLALQVEERVVAEDAARWASTQKTRFVNSVSYELRTPLTAIMGYTELVLDQPKISVEAASRDLGLVLYSATHLLGLIDDILDLSGVDTERGIAGDEVALSDVVHEVVEVMRHRAADRNAHLEASVDTSFRCPRGCQKAKHILFTLLGVAARYTSGGPVTIDARDTPGGARVIVSLSGDGLSAADLQQLFDPFVDLGGPHRSGVGLALSLEYAQALGGELVVESAPGAGTRFLLSLPRR